METKAFLPIIALACLMVESSAYSDQGIKFNTQVHLLYKNNLCVLKHFFHGLQGIPCMYYRMKTHCQNFTRPATAMMFGQGIYGQKDP